MAAHVPIQRAGLLAALFSTLVTMSFATPTCQPPPTIQFKLSNCTLLSPDGNDDVYSWGIQMTISGSGDICVAPSTVVNSTVLAARGLCDGGQLVDANQVNMSESQCLSRRGGLVDASKVTPANAAGLNELNKGWIELAGGVDGAASATLQLDQDTVTMTEILATKGQLLTQSHLGLAAAAPVLQTLKDTGKIGARSWGLNSGSQSYSSPRSGSLVLGGYDGASRDGAWYNFPVKSQLDGKRYCPLQVEITSMTATISNSTKNLPPRSIVGISDTLPVCIEPYDNLFRIPDERWSRFDDLIRDFTGKELDPVAPRDYENELYNLEPGIVYPSEFGNFNITLRITIGNNLTVEIPSHEFQRPLRGLDKAGKPTVDTSKIELQIYHYSPGEPQNSPVFGKAFLSQLYLYVDYQSMMFHLAKQNLDVSTPLPVSNATCGDLSDNGGLSPTTKALIGVGALLGLVLFLLVLLGYCFYKQVWRPSRGNHPSAPPSVQPPTSEPSAGGVPGGPGGIPLVAVAGSSPPVQHPEDVSPPHTDTEEEPDHHDPRHAAGHGSPETEPITSGPRPTTVTGTNHLSEL
ncbi:hypothetical protein V8F33_009257 [Rhypophila sp. PSN 637]